jgi:hypothetical protein
MSTISLPPELSYQILFLDVFVFLLLFLFHSLFLSLFLSPTSSSLKCASAVSE